MSHHHHEDQLTAQITRLAAETCASPEVINRSIGLAMQHIGASLSNTAAPYMPISAGEVLVPPEQMGDSQRAVLLTDRMIRSENSQVLIITWMTIDGKIEFDTVAVGLNEFQLSESKFARFSDAAQQEINRQLGVLISSLGVAEGNLAINCTIVDNYFPKVD